MPWVKTHHIPGATATVTRMVDRWEQRGPLSAPAHGPVQLHRPPPRDLRVETLDDGQVRVSHNVFALDGYRRVQRRYRRDGQRVLQVLGTASARVEFGTDMAIEDGATLEQAIIAKLGYEGWAGKVASLLGRGPFDECDGYPVELYHSGLTPEAAADRLLRLNLMLPTRSDRSQP